MKRFRFNSQIRRALTLRKNQWGGYNSPYNEAMDMSKGNYNLGIRLLTDGYKFVYYAKSPKDIIFSGYKLPFDYYEEF